MEYDNPQDNKPKIIRINPLILLSMVILWFIFVCWIVMKLWNSLNPPLNLPRLGMYQVMVMIIIMILIKTLF